MLPHTVRGLLANLDLEEPTVVLATRHMQDVATKAFLINKKGLHATRNPYNIATTQLIVATRASPATIQGFAGRRSPYNAATNRKVATLNLSTSS
jgi:hypothetical protein